jgi:hypothetical protein
LRVLAKELVSDVHIIETWSNHTLKSSLQVNNYAKRYVQGTIQKTK